jgi:hypothetical protein
MSRQKGMGTDMKERAPAFQFYPRQFAADEHVMAMDLDAVGAHILLICAAAASPESYRIATDERAIRNRLRNPSEADWERIKVQLLAGPWKISEDGHWWEQHGLRRTVEKQKTFSESQRQRVSARYAGKLPDGHRKSTQQIPDGIPGGYSSSSSSSSNHKPTEVMPDACRTDAELMPGASSLNSTEVARALCGESGWSGLRMVEALKAALDFKSHEMPESSLEQVGEWLVKTFFDHEAEHGKFAAGPLAFFQQAKYPHAKRRPVGATLPVNDPAAYALTQMEGD